MLILSSEIYFKNEYLHPLKLEFVTFDGFLWRGRTVIYFLPIFYQDRAIVSCQRYRGLF